MSKVAVIHTYNRQSFQKDVGVDPSFMKYQNILKNLSINSKIKQVEFFRLHTLSYKRVIIKLSNKQKGDDKYGFLKTIVWKEKNNAT